MTCEQLPAEICSFAIASSGKRCVLENYTRRDGRMQLECKTSLVSVDFMQEWIETDDCIRACGLDRKSIGISSDALLSRHSTAKLCSPDCYQNCPNIVDLYFNLALAEGKKRNDRNGLVSFTWFLSTLSFVHKLIASLEIHMAVDLLQAVSCRKCANCRGILRG